DLGTRKVDGGRRAKETRYRRHLADDAVQRLFFHKHVVDRRRSGPVLDVQSGGCVSLRIQVNHEHSGAMQSQAGCQVDRRGGLAHATLLVRNGDDTAGRRVRPLMFGPSRAASAACAWLTATGPGAGTWAEEGMSTVAGRLSPTPARACVGTRFPVDPATGRTGGAVSGFPGAGTIGREPTGPLPCPPGDSCSKSAPAPLAGFPRLLTVSLPCASSRALRSRASVSRETAADSACFTRTGGPTGSPSRKTCPRPSSPVP